MTSRRRANECFVYITLPGETKPITAAKFEIKSKRRGDPVGRLVYGRKYLARPDAVDIDPVELKRSTRTYETALLGGVFGALRDASPDYWGRLVIDRARGVAHSEMDYLINAQDQGAGALGFGLNKTPPQPIRKFNQTIELKKLQDVAHKILNQDKKLSGEVARQVQRLMQHGTSMMGGARPKAVVEDRYGLWIAKFNLPGDKWNFARVENTMLKLAKSCRITAAQSKVTRLAGRDVLLVKRFDRERTKKGYLRARMVSGLTLLRADENQRNLWSYPGLVEEVRRVCVEPEKNAAELFRRMCFNALISNTDDHPRNHAIIAKDHDWKLSPAYDLTPSVSVSLDHRDLAMTVGDEGRFANARNLVSECRRFLLKTEEAEALVAEMTEQIRSTWYDMARAHKVTVKDCEAISGAFVYPGFEAQANQET